MMPAADYAVGPAVSGWRTASPDTSPARCRRHPVGSEMRGRGIRSGPEGMQSVFTVAEAPSGSRVPAGHGPRADGSVHILP